MGANLQGLAEVADPAGYAVAAVAAGHDARSFARAVGLHTYRVCCSDPACQFYCTLDGERTDYYELGNAAAAAELHGHTYHAEQRRDCLGSPEWVETLPYTAATHSGPGPRSVATAR